MQVSAAIAAYKDNRIIMDSLFLLENDYARSLHERSVGIWMDGRTAVDIPPDFLLAVGQAYESWHRKKMGDPIVVASYY